MMDPGCRISLRTTAFPSLSDILCEDTQPSHRLICVRRQPLRCWDKLGCRPFFRTVTSNRLAFPCSNACTCIVYAGTSSPCPSSSYSDALSRHNHDNSSRLSFFSSVSVLPALSLSRFCSTHHFPPHREALSHALS